MKEKKLKNSKSIYLIAIFIATVLMSIGYARVESVTSNLVGNANAIKATGVFIYDATINATSPANVYESNISIMYSTMMESRVVLNDNLSSTLTMNVTIYNKSDEDVYFDKTVYGDNFYDNNNIDFTLNGLIKGQKLSKNSNVSFTMTFKYTDEYKNSNPSSFANTLNSYIGFNFKKGYNITYTNISGSGYPELILEGENLNVDFGSNAPENIKVTGLSTSREYVSGTDYTYSGGVLNINNVSENLEITKFSNTPIGEPEEETIENNDGSTTTITTVTTESGEELVVGYDINTDNVQNNSISLPSGGIDTGVIAFDGNDFEVTLKARFTFNNCKSSICPIINVSNKNPKVNGILVYEFGNVTSGNAYNASGSKVGNPFNKMRYGKYENSSSTGNVDYNIASKVNSSQMNGRWGYVASNSPVVLTIKLYYIDGVFTSEIYDENDVLLAKPYKNTSYSFSNLNESFDDITVTLGTYEGFGDGVVYNHNFDIISFNVTKTIN